MTEVKQQNYSDAPSLAPTELHKRRAPSFEVWSWYFMRVSGVILLFLALGHFAITHIINDVANTDAEFVGSRWDNPLWRLYDWSLLSLGLLHGVNGLRYIIDDYVRNAGRRAVIKTVVYGVVAALFLYGTLTVVTFSR